MTESNVLPLGEPSYGLTRTLGEGDFTAAVDAVRAALSTEGFGVLTEIDVKATLKTKLDLAFQDYVILGACNPPLAHQALSAELGIGLLLPCNVVVTRDAQGRNVVSAIDPLKMFQLLDRDDVRPIAEEVRGKLERVLERIET